MYFLLMGLLCFMNFFIIQAVSSNTINNKYNNEYLTVTDIKKVIIVYFHDFPYQKKMGEHTCAGCFIFKKHPQSSAFYSKPVLRCKEKAHFLLPVAAVKRWQEEQSQNGFIHLNLPEFGLRSVNARIVTVIPVSSEKLTAGQAHTERVIGIFIRYSTDVRRYLFINEKTRRINTINVTGSHRFYVRNRHAFIAIKDVLSTDELLSDIGDNIKVICPAGKLFHCGQSFHHRQPVQVYNLETSRQHTYFAGSTMLLVHNPCGRITVTQYHPGQVNALKYEGQIDFYTLKYDGFRTLYHEKGFPLYRGWFSQGRYDGFGSLFGTKKNRGNLIYNGMFSDGLRHGRGIEYYDVYFATTEGVPIGPEKLYVGDFYRNFHSGHGTMYYPRDNTGSKAEKLYEGGWLKNAFHGRGILYPYKGKTILCGIWEEDRLLCSMELKKLFFMGRRMFVQF